MKILYVDDDPMMLRAVTRQLRGRGHVVLPLVEPVTNFATWTDVALLDWNPYGPVMVKRCREAGVPFVIYTGDVVDIEDVEVLTKPSTTGEIVDALLAACTHKQGRVAR